MALHITDPEFTESGQNRERLYKEELNRSPITNPDDENATYMDLLGRGRWPVDYLTARQRGYSHPDAMLVERRAIRAAAGLPQTEPAPPVPAEPVPPTPVPPPPGQDVPGVRDDMVRFKDFYAARCNRLNWFPNDTTSREERYHFLADTILEYGKPGLVMKRASITRPISDECVVFVAPTFTQQHRTFWDFIKSGGAANWRLSVDGDGEHLPGPEGTDGQLLVDPRSLLVMPG